MAKSNKIEELEKQLKYLIEDLNNDQFVWTEKDKTDMQKLITGIEGQIKEIQVQDETFRREQILKENQRFRMKM
jgi:hypothetical protein